MKKTTALLLALIAAATLFAGCQSDNGTAEGDTTPSSAPDITAAAEPATAEPTATGEVKYRETLNVGLAHPTTSTDPQGSNNQGGKVIFKMTHDPLVYLNTVTDELEPGVAERWEQTDDVTYVFYLRQGAKFHNGEEVKASDVVFTVERGHEASYTASVLGQIASIEALDDYTIEMKLVQRDVDWLFKISDALYSILSEKALADDPENGAAIGTGPYVFDEFVLNDYITMHKNDNYWYEDQLHTQNFRFRYIPEDSTRLIALQNGEIDCCLYPANNELQFISDDPNLVLYQMDSSHVRYISFNTSAEPGSNMKLRQAIASAVNKEDIITVAAEGLGTPAKTFWATNLFGFYDGFDEFTYDPDQARTLLSEAGYPDGLTIELACTSEDITAAEVIQAQLKRINIEININEMDSTGLTNYINQGGHEMLLNGRSYGATVEGARKVFCTGLASNDALYANERVDALFDLAGQLNDDGERLELYAEIQTILGEEVPYIPMYYRTLSWGTVKGLEGLRPQTGGMPHFAFCYIMEE